MKILATDMDRTLLPNGPWEADEQAIGLFNDLTEKHGILVVYVTGRNLDLANKAIAEYGVRHPHVLIGDVGTTIREYANGEWSFDEGWVAHVEDTSRRWNAGAVKEAVAGISGLREQEPEHLNAFKVSYYVDHLRSQEILHEVVERVEGRFDEAIVYSFDPHGAKGLLDFLPDSATKRTALEYVASEYECDKRDVVFCGDSGNDIFPLTAGFCGVLVRNADDQLVAGVRRAMEDDPNLEVYFARGGFRGLNGYYAGGVLEGAAHYGLLE